MTNKGFKYVFSLLPLSIEFKLMLEHLPISLIFEG